MTRLALMTALFPLVAVLGCSTPATEQVAPQAVGPQSAGPQSVAAVLSPSGGSSPGEGSGRAGGQSTRPSARVATIRNAEVPALSLNGRFLAYADSRVGQQRIVVLDRRSGITHSVRSGSDVSSLQVSNNGRWVAFIDDAGQPTMADLIQSSLSKVGSARGEVLTVSMTADALYLAYVTQDPARPSATSHLYDRLAGRVHESSSRALESVLSPDGSRILNITDGSPPSGSGQQPAPTRVATMLELGTGFAKQLPKGVGTQPSLDRGGRRIVSTQNWGLSDRGMGHAVVLEVASGRVTRITSGRAKPVISVISGNGRFVVARRFASADGAFSNRLVPTSVIRFDLKTGSRALLTRRMIGIGRPTTSASGRVIAWPTLAAPTTPGARRVPVVKVWVQAR